MKTSHFHKSKHASRSDPRYPTWGTGSIRKHVMQLQLWVFPSNTVAEPTGFKANLPTIYLSQHSPALCIIRTEQRLVRSMRLSGHLGHGTVNLVSQWESTIKLPCMCAVTRRYPSSHDHRWCQMQNKQVAASMLPCDA